MERSGNIRNKLRIGLVFLCRILGLTFLFIKDVYFLVCNVTTLNSYTKSSVPPTDNHKNNKNVMLIFKIENDVNTLIKLFIDIFLYELFFLLHPKMCNTLCVYSKMFRTNIFIEMSWKFNKCLISFDKSGSREKFY